MSEFGVPVEKALEQMYSFMSTAYGETRVGGRTIRSIETVSGDQIMPATRSGGLKVEEVLYVVNFEDNAGFAILAADTRLDPVIALAEEGNFSGIELFNGPPGPVDLNYPGKYVYCPEDDDYYMGGADLGEFLGDAIGNFVVASLANRFTLEQDYPVGEPRDLIIEYDPVRIIPEYTIAPMLRTRWHQRAPFNDKCPGGWGDGSDNHYPAGCVPIALAQIMAYNNYPSTTRFHLNSTATWADLIDYDFALSPSEEGEEDNGYNETLREDMAHIMYKMGAQIPVTYGLLFTDNTFATPAAARRLLRDAGYSSTNKYNDYRENIILEMLRTDRPVFIAAISSMADGHAWVIDGCIKEELYENIYDMNRKLLERRRHTSALMLHCNFGWEGKCNGYYKSGVFNLRNYALRYDPEVGDRGQISGNSSEYYFDWHTRIVTYGKP